MRKRDLLAFLFFPVVLVFAASVLLWMASKGQDQLIFRRSLYPAIEARGRAIDKAANISDEANNSALALARLQIRSIDELDAENIVRKALARFLFAIAGAQFAFIAWRCWKSRSSDITPQPDAHATRRAPLG